MHKTRLFAGLALLTAFSATSAIAAPAVFGETTSVKVRPSHPIRDDKGVDLIAARNEFAAFQVVIHGTTSGANAVSATMSDLVGPSTIPSTKMVVYRETLLNITQTSGVGPTAGMWPDGLVPDVDEMDRQKRNAFPFNVPANQARALWVDVHVPQTAAPGSYTGTLKVTGTGFTHNVQVRLTVVNATLPSTSSVASAFLIYGGTVCAAHTGDSECGYSTTTMANHLNRYQELALDHRITLTNFFKVGRQGDNWPAFDAMYSQYLNGTAKTRLVGAKMTSAQLSSNRDVAKFASWANHFKAKGWFDRLFDYTGDEPPYGITYTEAKARAVATRSADPALRTLLTTNIQDLEDNAAEDLFDILTPPINFMDGIVAPFVGNQRPKYDAYLAKPGKHLWIYQSCMSHGCGYGTELPENSPNSGWASYMVDRTAAKNRAMQWLVFKYGATGELYYETALALTRAWTDQFAFSGNGDGTLFYPGTPSQIGGTSHIPLPSIRLKQIRLGMQDYEWLKLVSEAGDPAFAKQIVDGLVPAASKVPDDGALFDAARLALINRYVQLTRPPEPVKPSEVPQVGELPNVEVTFPEAPAQTPTTAPGEEEEQTVEQPMWTEEQPKPSDDGSGGAVGKVGCSAGSAGSAAFGLLSLVLALRRRRVQS